MFSRHTARSQYHTADADQVKNVNLVKHRTTHISAPSLDDLNSPMPQRTTFQNILALAQSSVYSDRFSSVD